MQLYKSKDCSGKPVVQDYAATPLTDKETLGGKTHPKDMCIDNLGGGVSFMGSCPALDTKTMQYYNLANSKLEQPGMRYCA